MTDNKSTITTVVSTLCALAVLAVFTVCLCSYFGKQIPPELNTIVGGLVGALTAMLTKTSPTPSVNTTTPVDVKVTNPPEAPVNSQEVHPQIT